MKLWWKAAGIRALKTAAQAALGTVGGAAFLGEVSWQLVVSSALLASVCSLLTSVAGIPEVDGGASVPAIVSETEEQ